MNKKINKEANIYRLEKSKLFGKVKVSGAKNSVLRLMAASILTDEKVVLQNYPNTLLDAQIHREMLEVLGKKCTEQPQTLIIENTSANIISELVWTKRSIRNTLLILGALTAKTGEGSVPLPGGCSIGNAGENRGFDLHVMVLEKFGAEVNVEKGILYAKAPKGGLIGADIYLPIRSTGATENAILAGSLANGTTRIWNPHIRPEILDLIQMINAMGGEVKVHGQEHIEVIGKRNLRGVTHEVIPDNVEALTWLVGAAITGGEVEIEDFPFEHLEVPLIFLRESGAKMYRCDNRLIVRGGTCYPLDISTGPYPGINSDMQPILAIYGAKAIGQSTLVDLRFPGRYGYAKELKKMNVNSSISGNMLAIHGGNSLIGASVKALDLRAGISLSLAATIAEGVTDIQDAWQIERGYDQFFSKMKSLEVKISQVV